MIVLKRSAQFTILVLLTASFKFGWDCLQNGSIFPISIVKVEASYAHLSPKELKQAISSDLPASFWTVDIHSLSNRLKAISWVQSVDIQKIWPETLKIRVNEKTVMARWGQDGLLSDKEEIFYPDTISNDKRSFFVDYETLPILYGPVQQVKNIIGQYHTMQKILKSKELAIRILYLSQSGAWSLRLTNGTVLFLGKDFLLERLNRFLRFYDKFFAKNDAAEDNNHFPRRIDLRYRHGMAVSWAVEPRKET